MNPFDFDEFYRKSFGLVAGLDEAGRGSLAGPVVAAAVVLDHPIDGVRDSKELSRKRREEIYDILVEEAVFGVGIATPEEIDVLNILNATRLAMERAIASLRVKPDYVIVDGRSLKLSVPGVCIKGGDRKSLSISSASIIAKVLRDRIMSAYSRVFENYGFEKHFGYGTKRHMEALERFGPTVFHRLTFSGVVERIDDGVLENWLKRGTISPKRYEAVILKRRKMGL